MELLEQIVFAHISDLHFGARGSKRRGLRYKALGNRTHDSDLAEDLTNALTDAAAHLELESEADLHLVVSGDLTSVGADPEFDEVFQYIHQRSAPDGIKPLSSPKPRRSFLVAGNHEHWKDSSWSPNPLDDRPQAFNKAIYDQSCFKKPVEVQCWSSGSGKLRLELFGVDSASGLEPKTHNKRARGAISPKELQLLEDELTKRDREPVPAGAVWLRAIVCHHSLYFGSKGQTQKEYHQGANSLDDYSRQRLLDIARKNSVCAILTGHIHIFGDPYAHEKPPELRSPDSKPVWELNCTTTLQDPVDGRPNAFWVHRVRLFGGKPEWFAIPYASSSGLRFEEGKWSPLRPLTFRVQET